MEDVRDGELTIVTLSRLPLLPLRGLLLRSPPVLLFILSGDSGLEPTSFTGGSMVTVESDAETFDESKSPGLEERKESMRLSSWWALLWAILNFAVQEKSGCEAWVVCGDTRVAEVLVDDQDLCSVDVDFARGRSGERAGMVGGEEWDAAVIGGEVIALSKGFATRPERGAATTLPRPRPKGGLRSGLCAAGDCLASICTQLNELGVVVNDESSSHRIHSGESESWLKINIAVRCKGLGSARSTSQSHTVRSTTSHLQNAFSYKTRATLSFYPAECQ